MKKAAIIAPNSLPVPPVRGGGVQTVIAETVPLFKSYKPYVISNCEFGIDNLPLRETAGNVEYRRICQSNREEFWIRLRNFSTKNYLPYVLEAIKYINEIKPDVIHLTNRPWFLPILRKHLGKGQKMILHHFNNYLMEMPAWKAKGYLDHVDAFIGCSEFTVTNEVIKRFPQMKDKCFVISNGVDTSKFDPSKISADKKRELRSKYRISADDTVILYVGRLSEDKGAYELVEAIKKLVLSGKMNIKLLIVGSSFFGGPSKVTPFINKLRSVSASLKDHIVFTGYIDRKDIQDVFAIGDIVAVPSIVNDASPTVCYEASSMELPVVASTRGGIPELVKDGETGLLYKDPYDIEALSGKLRFFIDSPEKRALFGKKGRVFIEKNFTWKIVADKMEKAYNRVLNS